MSVRSTREPARVLIAVAALAVLLVAVAVFIPPLGAAFVSDTFSLYYRALHQTPNDLVASYVPNPTTWYRPTTDLVFWVEAHLFGTSTVPYRVVTLALHLVSVGLVARVALRLGGTRLVAAVGAVVFLLLPHAQEPLWDIADLHTALAAVFLLGAVNAYVSGARRLALAVALIGLTVDEAGLVTIALVGLWEAVIVRDGWNRAGVVSRTWRLAPFALLAVAYVVLRLLAGHIANEVADTCASPKCLVVGVAEYFNRFWVRPDQLLRDAWTNRLALVGAGVVVVGLVVLLARPWRWPDRRPAVFAFGWIAGVSAFFILTLWPYIPDRLLYLPDAGLALLLGAVAAHVASPLAPAAWSRRASSVGLIAIGAVWLLLGIPMLIDRGQGWITAGQRASAIVADVQRLVPDPTAGSVLAIEGAPREIYPDIAPGNTGPYVFINGLPEAMYLAYGRSDFTVVPGPPPSGGGTTHHVLVGTTSTTLAP